MPRATAARRSLGGSTTWSHFRPGIGADDRSARSFTPGTMGASPDSGLLGTVVERTTREGAPPSMPKKTPAPTGRRRSVRPVVPLELVDRIIAATLNFRRSRALLRTAHEMYLVDGTELTRVQVDILEALATRGHWTVGDLAKHLEADPATVSRTSAALIKLGLAARSTSNTDRRLSLVGITPTGFHAHKEIVSRRRALARQVLKGVDTAEIETMVLMMERWLRLNEAVLDPTDPSGQP